MKRQQQETIKKILDVEQITISKLADSVEISRSTLSKLINHNEQLSEKLWEKLKEAYPEHIVQKDSEEHASKFKKFVEQKNKTKLTEKVVPAMKKHDKIKVVIDKQSEEEKENKVIKGSIVLEKVFENDLAKEIIKNFNDEISKTTKKTIIEGAATILNKKDIKTKEENRHRNLNCPESNYHMKVPYKDLLRARPLCPLTQLPMMLKEEVKKYKSLDENERKSYTESLNPNINLLNK